MDPLLHHHIVSFLPKISKFLRSWEWVPELSLKSSEIYPNCVPWRYSSVFFSAVPTPSFLGWSFFLPRLGIFWEFETLSWLVSSWCWYSLTSCSQDFHWTFFVNSVPLKINLAGKYVLWTVIHSLGVASVLPAGPPQVRSAGYVGDRLSSERRWELGSSILEWAPLCPGWRDPAVELGLLYFLALHNLRQVTQPLEDLSWLHENQGHSSTHCHCHCEDQSVFWALRTAPRQHDALIPVFYLCVSSLVRAQSRHTGTCIVLSDS